MKNALCLGCLVFIFACVEPSPSANDMAQQAQSGDNSDATPQPPASNRSTVAHRYSQPTIHVEDVSSLLAAIATANRSGGMLQIVLADGEYRLTQTLQIRAPGIVLRSKSGQRHTVRLMGDAMAKKAMVKNLFWVAADDFVLDGISLSTAGHHLIQIAGEQGADRPIIRNCLLEDAYQQLVKVTWSAQKNSYSTAGIVEHCLFRYSLGIGPAWYIGGIDAHGIRNWLIRHNRFENIASPERGPAEHAIHIWNGSKDNTVEKNTIVDCDRGIGFGMKGTGKLGNNGGIIRNNFIHSSGKPAHRFADAAITLEESSRTWVYHNTMVSQSNYASSIEYRWPSSKDNFIFNNLSNKRIQRRNAAQAQLANNYTKAKLSWFTLSEPGDLHLNDDILDIVNAGKRDMPQLGQHFTDIDGQPRNKPDIGADEYYR